MTKKAILEMVGRIGNQFYVYFTGLRLEDLGYSVKYDLEYYSQWPKKRKHRWTVELDYFKVVMPVATRKEVSRYLWRTNNRHINLLLKRKKYFSKKVFQIKEFFRVLPSEGYIYGFDGTEKELLKKKDHLRKSFTLKEKYKKNIKKILQRIKKENSVAINVRRGDLLRYKDANILSMDYYKKAVKMIHSKVKNPQFFISSDDISWCKENFDWLDDKEFIEFKSYENFEIVKNCKHLIAANSTFSWWAGFLNPYKNAIIIAPKDFHIRERHRIQTKRRFPSEWIWI